MIPFQRGAAPAGLASQSVVLTSTFTGGAEFNWPRSLYVEVRVALSLLTEEHCSYCDWLPIDVSGSEEVDHFKPKSVPEFRELAYEWTNLFLCCSACNKHKLAQWNEKLLRPDEAGYEFSRYFMVNALTGELAANPAASELDRERAQASIRVFGLNRAGLCTSRRDAIRRPRTDAERPFRFLS